ncbi:sugar isomerase domain-containing protein [Streptomyces sp. AJS327]|uniref:sugar isomerase domain-containing protein n=1 Tax=Streptomyces sp. AJS327 TaxID=2545265 RepID=UPI0015DDD8E5|nr:SIS domain-containing protein [Streptomyces sp. AJS327]MBA0049959.1 sugar isomerase domain-containing protein [Streptomyces sp. AJS327]
MTDHAIDAATFTTLALETIARVSDGQHEAVLAAAALWADSLAGNGVIQAFGTGHSEALATEISGRAGGFVPTNKLALRDVVLRGDKPKEFISDPHLERDPATARALYEIAAPHPQDVFVIASNSGINGSIVEMATIVKEHGHPLIAVTSVEHGARSTSRHPSGKRLPDFADVLLDNGAPFGDSLLELPGGGTACAISSITGALLVQLIAAETIRLLLARDITPPVYLSANIPAGDEHNKALEARYAGRINRTA